LPFRDAGSYIEHEHRIEEVGMPLSRPQSRERRKRRRSHDRPQSDRGLVRVRIAAVAELPTCFGRFQVVAFWNNKDGKEHAAFVRGDVTGAEDVPARLHSECLTGDAIGSLRCDCRDQMETAMATLGRMEKGVLLYLRQEGRGIGLINKIRAYGLQDHGYDTVEANLALGFRDDEREYRIAAQMIGLLKIRSVLLMTNNPRKMEGLSALGIRISGRIPLVIPPNPCNRFYLQTKRSRSGHLLDPSGWERLPEQIDRPVIEGMSGEQAMNIQEA
jgi:GTP cyclohydrolase II